MSFERNDGNRLGEKLKFICTIEDALPVMMLKITLICLLAILAILIGFGILSMGKHLLNSNEVEEVRPNEVENDNGENDQREQV
jgi:hypothetical protein